jgi:hypothetical protein
MLARSAASLVLLAELVGSCGGAPPPPPAEPVHPGPIVAWTPPAPSVPARPPTPPSTPAPPPAPKPSPAPAEPALRCVLAGRAQFQPGTPIQNAEGRPLARFSGADATVRVSEFTLGSNPRARLETGTARASFRLRGFVDAAKVPLFTTARVPIAAGYLAIGERRGVSVQSVSPDKLKIERIADPPLEQSFTAWTSCSAVSIEPGTPPGWSPPGDARGYALNKSALELFDTHGGATVGVVHKAPGAAVLFFSNEQSSGWVHVERHADIIVDAWAKASGLSALARGETLDQAAAPSASRGAARLALPNEPRVLKTLREVPLRVKATDSEAPVGVIGADTETFVIEVMAGWVSVLPKALDVMPVEGGQFWAKKSDLGL